MARWSVSCWPAFQALIPLEGPDVERIFLCVYLGGQRMGWFLWFLVGLVAGFPIDPEQVFTLSRSDGPVVFHPSRVPLARLYVGLPSIATHWSEVLGRFC